LAKSSTNSLDSIVAAAADRVSRELDGEAAILNLASGACHGLDPDGAAPGTLIASPIAGRDIVDATVDPYDADSECCERDLSALLVMLGERGLIQVTDGAGR
jgi:hypothetical protein